MTERQWKTLGPGRQSLISGTRYQYPAHGAWTRHLNPDSLIECEQGYHYCTGPQILEWLDEGLLCEVKHCPQHKPLEGDGKSVTCQLRIVRSYRLDARVLRLFACDCAERALRRERKAGREPDKRSWQAIKVARRYAEGKATETARDAARDAAGDAAGDAARAAAWDAARDAARDAAWDAAGDAAGYAARDAARAAARAAARDAARDAAWDAAWDAARDAAGYAARAAARDAAWDAARDAAGDAERDWQYRRLLKLAGVA